MELRLSVSMWTSQQTPVQTQSCPQCLVPCVTTTTVYGDCVCVCVCVQISMTYVFSQRTFVRGTFWICGYTPVYLGKNVTLIHGRVDNETLSIQSGPTISPT